MNNKFFHSVYLEEDLCQGCINCIKRCPTQAIRVRNGKARIIKEFCIDCGECIRHCPHHAKLTRRDHFDLVRQFEYSVALPAPSLYGQFNNLNDINIVLTALKYIGFDDVFEVSGAAELVSASTREYVENHKDKWPLISTACPTIVRLIRVRFPNLLPNLLPLQPPVEIAAKIARRKAMEKTGLSEDRIGIFFISPCPSKVTAQKSPLGDDHSELDGVLAIQDIYPMLLSQMKEAEAHPEDLSVSGKIGVGWGISGGEAAGLFTDSYLAADGIENVIKVLEDLEDEKIMSEIRFIELNSCSGGCVGGVLNVENPFVAKAKMKHLNKYLPVSLSHTSDYPPDINPYLSQDIKFEPVYQLGENLQKSMENLEAVDTLTAVLPGLDCGSCGAPTCKALAEDIVRGHAKKEDCTYLLRDYYIELKKSQLLEEAPNDRT